MNRAQNSGQQHAPKASPSARWSRLGWWVTVSATLLVVNYWAGSQAMGGPSRVRVPYSPFFPEHRDQLDSLAEALLEHETLDQDDAYAAAGIVVRRAQTNGAVAIAAQSIVERP